MKLSIGCDHGGYETKEKVKEYLISKGHIVIDCGTDSLQSCNYPEFAFKAAMKVKEKEADKGILICTSGEGIMIAANKVEGIRCGIGYNDEVSSLIVQHNHCNMIAFGAKYMSAEDIERRIDIFLSSTPLEGRHEIRVKMIEDYEKNR